MIDKYIPKKKFSQNFLIDNDVVKDIVNSANIKENDIVWEIGPGLGALTDELIKKDITLTIFEIDKDIYNIIKSKYNKAKIINADILKINWKDEINELKINIISNLPYQITSPFLYKLTENIDNINSVVVMLQKEVANRLCAKPGKKEYGFLTIKTQFYFNTTKLFDVPAYKFNPIPKIDSTVIKLLPRKDIPQIIDDLSFWKLVEKAFSAKRKTLKNNLKDTYPSIINNTNIDLNRRAETLSENEFIDLYNLSI
jgi:16S rRNA (adenine1518-N6/adenine1519-N6)-dimethyltransferase